MFSTAQELFSVSVCNIYVLFYLYTLLDCGWDICMLCLCVCVGIFVVVGVCEQLTCLYSYVSVHVLCKSVWKSFG